MPEKETVYEKACQALKKLEDKLAWYSQQEEEPLNPFRQLTPPSSRSKNNCETGRDDGEEKEAERIGADRVRASVF
jgi:hypothetical protein